MVLYPSRRYLKTLYPMAWDFAINFAKDNDLQMAEACLIPDVGK